MDTQKSDGAAVVEIIKLAGRNVGSIVADAILDKDTQILTLTAERDKYRDACKRLVATGANLVKVIEAATVLETMFVMGNRKDKAFQEVEQIVGAKNLLKWQLADAADFARQVKAELEGIKGSEIVDE